MIIISRYRELYFIEMEIFYGVHRKIGKNCYSTQAIFLCRLHLAIRFFVVVIDIYANIYSIIFKRIADKSNSLCGNQ